GALSRSLRKRIGPDDRPRRRCPFPLRRPPSFPPHRPPCRRARRGCNHRASPNSFPTRSTAVPCARLLSRRRETRQRQSFTNKKGGAHAPRPLAALRSEALLLVLLIQAESACQIVDRGIRVARRKRREAKPGLNARHDRRRLALDR